MDAPNATNDEAPLSGTIVVESRTVRRPLSRNFWLTAVLVPLLVTIGVGVSAGPGIENALKKDVQHALSDAGLENVAVRVDGRMVTADVPTGVEADTVKSVVDRVDGVSAVSTNLVYGSYAEAKGCADLQAKLDKATRNQRIPFQGGSARVSADGTKMLREVATLLDGCQAAVVYVGGHTDPATRYGSTLSLDRARLMAKTLKSFGIDSDRLEPRGYGDQFPLDKSGTAAGRARNERGSIIVRSQ